MKRLILALLLFLALSAGFSDAVSDFVANNLNFVIAAFTFVLIFGLSMGVAGIWVDKQEQITIISLGISALIAVIVMLNPNLSAMVSSIIQYSSTFLIAFIAIALILTILMSKKPLIKGVAIAILLAAIIAVIYLNGGIDLSGSGASAGFNPAPPLIALAIIIAIFIIVLVFYLKNRGSSASPASPPASVKISSSYGEEIKIIAIKKNIAGNYEVIETEDNIKINGTKYNISASLTVPEYESVFPIEIIINGVKNYKYFLKSGRFKRNCKIGKEDYDTLSVKSTFLEKHLIPLKETYSLIPVNSATFATLEIDRAQLNKYNVLLIIYSPAPSIAVPDAGIISAPASASVPQQEGVNENINKSANETKNKDESENKNVILEEKQVKIIVVEPDTADNTKFNVVKEDKNVNYEQLSSPKSNISYSISKDSDDNYFFLGNDISVNLLQGSYDYLIVRNSNAGDCRLGYRNFNFNFKGDEKGLTISGNFAPIRSPKVFSAKELEAFNFIILKKKAELNIANPIPSEDTSKIITLAPSASTDSKQKATEPIAPAKGSATLIISIYDAEGNPFKDVKIDSIESADALGKYKNIALYKDSSLKEKIPDPKTDDSGKFTCYIEADGKKVSLRATVVKGKFKPAPFDYIINDEGKAEGIEIKSGDIIKW
jgi:hypothetical protein